MVVIDVLYFSTNLDCCHCWERIQNFTTWVSDLVSVEVSEWACWYSDYRCIMCGEVVTLPMGEWPGGGRVLESPWDEEWDELLEGVSIE